MPKRSSFCPAWSNPVKSTTLPLQAASAKSSDIFFDADGHILDTALTARTLSASFPKTKKERLVALAGGQSKVAAIRAILNSRRLFGLITDERTAQALLK
ncbi:sugar-binding domain-containing protein (plasmid) [Rhizobium ruizarguesonis]|uniref:Sugar-binding domain-containing protein n=1 Tax=Rhizobium ruizarguesonis TaxID=2081791 RepID=A0ACD5EW26_9HYPH